MYIKKKINNQTKKNQDKFKRLLFNANSAIFQPYHGENKLIVGEMKMRSILY